MLLSIGTDQIFFSGIHKNPYLLTGYMDVLHIFLTRKIHCSRVTFFKAPTIRKCSAKQARFRYFFPFLIKCIIYFYHHIQSKIKEVKALRASCAPPPFSC